MFNVMIVMLLAMVEVVGVSNEGIHQKETSAKYYQSMDGLLCRKCSQGQYMKSACEKQYGMSICDRCPNETYMHSANNRSKCNHCTICQMTQIVVQPCTAVQDSQCGCKEGMEWIAADGGQGQCLRILTTSAKYYQSMDGLLCRKCSQGQYMKSACEKQYGMSICDRCPNETYMHSANNRSKCNHCTICQMTQIVVQPCTAVQDSQCGCKEGMEWIAADGGQGQCLRILTTEPHETTSPTPPTTSPPSTITPTPCPNCAESENQSCSGIVIFGYIMGGVLIGVLLEF